MAGSSATIRFFGALDSARRGEVRLRFACAEDADRVLVDLRDVSGIGPMFLVELLLFKRRQDRRIAVIADSPSVARVLWPVSLDAQTAVFASEAAARRWLNSRSVPSPLPQRLAVIR